MGTVDTQLSYQERRRIEDWWLAKVPVAEMAAHQRTQKRRSSQRKLIRYPELCERVCERIK